MVEFIYTDEELDDYLNRLNMLYSPWPGWQSTKARKEHTDLFGIEIKRNEIYFKRSDGPAFVDVQKVSMVSMQNLIYSLFNWNFELSETLKEAWDKDPYNSKNYLPTILNKLRDFEHTELADVIDGSSYKTVWSRNK